MVHKTKLIYVDDAINDLKKLEKSIAKKITKKLDSNSLQENPLANAKSLTGEYQGYHRYRIGDYRAVFEYDAKGQVRVIVILKISHRKNIY